MAHKRGTLIIIGGREDRESEMPILREVVRRLGRRKLCVATVASTVGQELWIDYQKVFKQLGVKRISHLNVDHRTEAVDRAALKAVQGIGGIFFTGGDQLKITSEIGGTKIYDEILRAYENGGIIAGTSAGAAVMSETMLVAGAGETSYCIGSGVRLAPGLGFIKDVIIDQHFSERGRIGRLLGVVAQNPKYLGLGIDEDTAIVMLSGKRFRVMGKGAVYVVDAHEATASNLSDLTPDCVLSLFNIRLHVLSNGDELNLGKREPKRGS